MYNKCKTSDIESSRGRKIFAPVHNSFSEDTESFHPQSYYIKGGVDISGRHLALDGDEKFDSETELKSGNIQAAAFSNPRMGFFEIVDALGADAAQAELEKAKNKDQTEEKTE